MTGGYVTRRTVTRGAAWSLPIVATAAAAPAFAGSTPTDPGPFTGLWWAAEWTPGPTSPSSEWLLYLTLDNSASAAAVTVPLVQVFSSYDATIAANGGTSQRIQTSTIGYSVNAGEMLGVGIPMFHFASTPAPVPPRDAQGNDITLSYYNPGPRTPPCVTTRRPSDAGYPASGARLLADHTYLVVHYTYGGPDYAKTLAMDATVGCRVTGSFCTA